MNTLNILKMFRELDTTDSRHQWESHTWRFDSTLMQHQPKGSTHGIFRFAVW